MPHKPIMVDPHETQARAQQPYQNEMSSAPILTPGHPTSTQTNRVVHYNTPTTTNNSNATANPQQTAQTINKIIATIVTLIIISQFFAIFFNLFIALSE